ncbi:virus tail tube protein gp19 [Pedococcus dokdonensis]|uniref:Virus tail tube protein gp19 n=1 Tax=Pedococcus dokdonensis TaxID=443156 RepID=A0A1H0SVJ8_9MICO|nr:phage tail protein [Pedococcus dokdonensis]SDP45639.1 virus tail tube protein gp19 [Pedococcus dokdonensis]
MAINSGKGYSAGAFALELEGKLVGFVRSVEGGGVRGDVVHEPPGPDGVVHKHLGGVRYDDIVVTSALPEGDWAAWLTAFLEGKAPQHDGAVIFLNYSYQPVRRLEFRHATIVSLTFPELDAAGKTAGYLTVTLRPEEVVESPATGSVKATSTKSQPWATSRFRVEIPGVDCTRVSSVGALTVSQTVVEDAVGTVRTPTRAAGPLEVGDLVLTVSQLGAADFTRWADDFIVKGNNSARDEKTATVSLLTQNLKDTVFSFTLKGVGIHRLDPTKKVQDVEAISRFTAELYCEQIELDLPKSEAAPPTSTPSSTPPRTEATDRSAPGRSILAALGERRLEPLDVARRLVATGESATAPSDADAQRQRGAQLGAVWAQRVASLDELTRLAAAARGDWTAIALPEGHSLLEVLQDAEVVPGGHDGALDLARDSFVEGLVDGAADTYVEVRAHLDRPDA